MKGVTFPENKKYKKYKIMGDHFNFTDVYYNDIFI